MLKRISTVITIVVFVFCTSLAIAANRSDAVSGEWNAVFLIAGHSAEGTMTFAVEGEKVTGTVVTAHTGPGTIADGIWKDGKLSFTANFEKHESIAITGTLKEGKLEGTFATEGMTGTWTGTKK